MHFDKIASPQELLNFMSENIKYGFIGKNGKRYLNQDSKDWFKECLVQTGNQVLETKIGTCWDQVELERLWFEKNNYEIKTIFIIFEVNYENDFPTHTFLLYKKNDKWYWFENAFEDFRGIHEFESVKDAIDFVKSKHLEYAIKSNIAKQEDKDLIVTYDYSKLIKALNVEDYLNHVTKHRINI